MGCLSARPDMLLGLQLVEESRTVSNGRAIEISIVGETEGQWDKARIGQVLSNLIGNALQYSPEHTPAVAKPRSERPAGPLY